MKTASKNLALGISIGSIILLAVTSPALAIEGNDDTTKQNTQTAVCNRIDSLKTKSDNAASGKVEALRANFQKRLEKIVSDQQSIYAKVTAARQEKMTQFEARIQNMLSKPDLTEEQKTAIETFRNSVRTAETKREQAVDAARNTFQEELKKAVAANQQKMLTAATTYQQAVLDAFSTAKTNCANEGALATLRVSIKTAREALTRSRESNQLGQTISQLAQTRTNAIKQANDEFKTSANGYAKTLAEALGSTAQSDESNQ